MSAHNETLWGGRQHAVFLINDNKFKRRRGEKNTSWNVLDKWPPRAGIFGPGSRFKALKDGYQRGRFPVQRYEAVAGLQLRLLTRLHT